MGTHKGKYAKSEVEKLAGVVNGLLGFIIKLFIWCFAFGGVTALLLMVGFENNFTVITAFLICLAWAAARYQRKKG